MRIIAPEQTAPRENFIPLRKSELIDLLCREQPLGPDHERDFRRLCELLGATLHFEYHARLEELKDAYAPFDPDADTRSLRTLTESERGPLVDQLFDGFTSLLERANFTRLTTDDIQRALASASQHGLRLEVDFDCFDRLEMFSRGEVTAEVWRRDWKTLFRRRSTPTIIYQRLAILFRLRDGKQKTRGLDTQDIFIKLFKDIPKPDLEMLLPGTRVKMSVVDRIKIIFPTVSGLIVSALKAFKGAMMAAAAGFNAVVALCGVTLGYGVKSFLGYLRTRQKYQLNLTESLYYQNLDNNAGVICRLLDEAEEQELREVALAYYFLWRLPTGHGYTSTELDERVEQFLAGALGQSRPVDFEIDDALAKLSRFGLAQRDVDGRYTAAPLLKSLATLDRAWDNYFAYAA